MGRLSGLSWECAVWSVHGPEGPEAAQPLGGSSLKATERGSTEKDYNVFRSLLHQ